MRRVALLSIICFAFMTSAPALAQVPPDPSNPNETLPDAMTQPQYGEPINTETAKKVAAGANLAITQVGWDARKFAELKRYIDERAIDVPVLGNVYVLGRRAAERMAKGLPPGCWASPELVDAVRKESQAPDGGLEARLERAAQTVAVLKGLGYAGAYIGG